MSAKQTALSKPPTARPKKPAPRKPGAKDGVSAPIAHIGPAPHVIAETIVQLIPYPLLGRAPENVRHTREHEDVSELADDIAAHGLLQSLIGYQDETDTIFPNGYTWIVGGGRRLAALALLHTRGIIDDDYRVPVVVRDVEDAIELSLSENLARRNMSPVDEFFAFEQLMRPGTTSPAELAKRFGFTERYVKQRLRLAGLAPEIIEALRDRQITLEAATAYASSQDRDAQLRSFKKQGRVGYKPHDPETIRRDLSLKTYVSEGSIAKFVGAEAYEAAGGRYDDDLFSHNPDPDAPKRLVDGKLLERLAMAKMEQSLVPFVSELNKAGEGLNAGAVIAPSIDVSDWQWTKPKPPADFVLVECNYDREKRWNAARNCGAQVKGIVGLDREGEMILVNSCFFVSKDKLKEVVPPLQPHRSATPEEIEARRRTSDIEIWSRRLAIGSFAGTIFDGRVTWPPEYERGSERMIHPELGEGYAVNLRIFVPKAAADANAAAAEAKIDAIAAEKKAAREAEERRKAGLDEEHNARLHAIADMSPEPAVVFVDDRYFFRWADGSYQDVVEEEDAESEYGFDELTQMLAEAEKLGEAYATIAEFDAAQEAAAAGREAPTLAAAADRESLAKRILVAARKKEGRSFHPDSDKGKLLARCMLGLGTDADDAFLGELAGEYVVAA